MTQASERLEHNHTCATGMQKWEHTLCITMLLRHGYLETY